MKNVLKDWSPVDIATLLQELPKEEMALVFKLLSREMAAKVFFALDSVEQELLLKEMSEEKIKEMVADLSIDDRTELFEELPGNMSQKIINLLTPEERERVLEILGYPEESVGRLITPDIYLCISFL